MLSADGEHGAEQERVLEQVAAALDAQDPYLDGHSKRVARYASITARRMGLPDEEVARIRAAATIHDVGKLRVSGDVLRKPEELTEAEFEELLAFLGEAQLDRVGCFAYSPVEGAAANALPNPVPEEVKEARRERFMRLQEKISAARLKRKVGKDLTVLVDEVTKNGAVARSSADAPEIDGQVFIGKARGLKPGDFTTVRVTRSDAHDLWAETT